MDNINIYGLIMLVIIIIVIIIIKLRSKDFKEDYNEILSTT